MNFFWFQSLSTSIFSVPVSSLICAGVTKGVSKGVLTNSYLSEFLKIDYSFKLKKKK